MSTSTRSRGLQRVYPPDFTYLIAEVTDTAMKAIIEPDPARYIQEAAASSTRELTRLRCGLTAERRRDPALAAAFRCDVVRNRVVHDLATLVVQTYERLRQMEDTVTQMMPAPVPESSRQKADHGGRWDGTPPVHGPG